MDEEQKVQEQTTSVEQQPQINGADLDKHYEICPCCGKPTLPVPVTPNAQLLDHWLACMATGVPFSRTYPLYAGRVKITVTQLTPENADAVTAMCTKLSLIASNIILDDLSLNVDMLASAAKICIGIESIEMKANGQDLLFKPAECVLKAAELLKQIDIGDSVDKGKLANVIREISDNLISPKYMSAVPPKLLLLLLETHNKLYDVLLNAGLDKNFWDGIKLA